MSASNATGGALTAITAWGATTAGLHLLSGHWPDDELAARGGFMLAFALLSVTVIVGAMGAARAALPGRIVAVSLVPAAILAAVLLRGDLAPPAVDLLLGAAVLSEGVWIGAALGRGVMRASHLWPLVVVAVGADLWSVVSPEGVTHQLVVEGPPVDAWWLGLVMLHLPVPGLGSSPLLGVGDVLFTGLLCGAAHQLGLNTTRLGLGLAAGFGVTLIGLLVFAVPLPALCFLAPLGVAALGSEARPSAREMALAMGVVVALFGVQLALR